MKMVCACGDVSRRLTNSLLGAFPEFERLQIPLEDGRGVSLHEGPHPKEFGAPVDDPPRGPLGGNSIETILD